MDVSSTDTRTPRKAWAGIGSRETPESLRPLMEALAARLVEQLGPLRSGGAKGADQWFESGARRYLSQAELPPEQGLEIYIPKKGFGWREKDPQSDRFVPGARQRMGLPYADGPGFIVAPDLPNWQSALETIRQYHPNPEAVLRNTAFAALHGRNAYQIQGRGLDDPVGLVVAYTKGGSGQGGTGQALRSARDMGLPILDLGSPGAPRLAERYLAGELALDKFIQEVAGATGSRGSAAMPRRPIEGGDPVALSMKSSNSKSAVTPEAAGELPEYLVEPGNLSEFQRSGVMQAPGLEDLPDKAKVIVVSDQDPGRRVLAEVNRGRLLKIEAIKKSTSEPAAVQELANRRPELRQAVASVFPTAALSSVDPGDELFQRGLPKIFTADDLKGLIQREGLIGKREQLDSSQVLYRLQDYFTQATPAEAVSIVTLRSPETGKIDGYAVFDADQMGSRGVNLSRSKSDGSSTRVSFIDLNDDLVSIVREERDPSGNTVEVKDAYIPRKTADAMMINLRDKDGFREDADNNATLWEDLEASGVPLQSDEDRSRPEPSLLPPDLSTSEESPTRERRPAARRRKPREMTATSSTSNAPEEAAEAVVQVMTEAAASASPSERPQALRDLGLAIEKLQEIKAKTHARRIEGVVNASQAVEKDYADMLERQQGLKKEVEDGLLQQEELRKQIASAVIPDEQKMKANWRLAKQYGLPALAGVLGVAAGGILFGGGDEVVVVDAGRGGGQQG